jgi:uncharacterized protein YjbI with pentapeptide repeats
MDNRQGPLCNKLGLETAPRFSFVQLSSESHHQRFVHQIFFAIILRHVDTTLFNLEGVSFAGAKMQWADLAYHWKEGDGYETSASDKNVLIRKKLELPNADFSSAELEGADLSNANLTEANFSGAGLEGAYLSSSELQGADFSYAHLLETDLSWVQLQGANFRKARLVAVNLSVADMTSARLDVHTIEMSFFVATDLGDVSTNRRQEDFDNTFGDAAMVLPPGIKAPCHWPDSPTSGRYYHRWHADWMAGKIPPIAHRSDGTCPERL